MSVCSLLLLPARGAHPVKYYLKELPPLLLWIFSAVALFAVVLLIPCELLVSTFLTVTRTPFAWEANKIYSSCHQTAWLYSCHFQQSPYKALRDVHWPSFVAHDSFTAFLSSSQHCHKPISLFQNSGLHNLLGLFTCCVRVFSGRRCQALCLHLSVSSTN